MEQSKLRQQQQPKMPRRPQNVPRQGSAQDGRPIRPNGVPGQSGPPLFRRPRPEMQKIVEDTTPSDNEEPEQAEPSQLLADLSDSEEEQTMTLEGEVEGGNDLLPPPLPPAQPFQKQQHPYGAARGVEQQSEYQYPPGSQQPPQ